MSDNKILEKFWQIVWKKSTLEGKIWFGVGILVTIALIYIIIKGPTT
jgi:hypothetical protein